MTCYKGEHRDYADLLTADVRSAGVKVRTDTRRWQADVEDHVREQGFDAVVESALADPQEFRADARAYRRSGHRIEIVALATAQAWSQLGVLDRFVEQVTATGTARYVSWDNHDACAAGLIQALAVIEAEQLADRVTVVRRAAGSTSGSGVDRARGAAGRGLSRRRGSPGVRRWRRR